MTVELGGGWKLLISFKMELEQTAQHRGLHLRGDPPACSSPKVERLGKKEVLFPNKPVPALNSSSITLVIPPAMQPSLSETWCRGQRGLVQ